MNDNIELPHLLIDIILITALIPKVKSSKEILKENAVEFP